MMKLLILAISLSSTQIFAHVTPKTRQQLVEERAACFAESKLSDQDINLFKMGQIPDGIGCFFRCMGLKAAIWDDTQGFDNDKAYESLTAGGFELEKEKFVECNSVDKKNIDPCKWATDVTKCMWDNKYIKRKV